MKRKAWKMLCALALMVALCVSLTTVCVAEGSAGCLYRVSGGRNEMVILGSIHVGSEAMYPLGSHIQNALDAADTLVFECDTESPEVMQETISMMVYPVGNTLRDNVSEEAFTLLEQAGEAAGYPVGMLNAYKPWAVVSMFSLQSTAAQMGVSDVQESMLLGVENQIRLLAPDKPMVYLETAREQLEIMDGFSPALQEYMLTTTCETVIHPESVAGTDDDMSMWPDWWREGNADAFAETYREGIETDERPELMKEYHDGLVTRRNANMANRLAEMLEGEDEHCYFVTVGLLHLVLEDDSVLSNLEQMGYTVERILP